MKSYIYKNKFQRRSRLSRFRRLLLKKLSAGAALKRTIFIFLLLAVLYILFLSPFFYLEKIEMAGNERIESGDIEGIIKEEISKPILGFIPGNNFFTADIKKIEFILGEKFPEIELASVNKEPPDIVRVIIKEKRPVLVWCRLDSCYYLDNRGVSFLDARNNIEGGGGKKIVKVIEQKEIVEEGKKEEVMTEDGNQPKNEVEKKTNGDVEKKEENKIVEEREEYSDIIETGEKIADENFVNFVLEVDKELESGTILKIKYYKTKGIKSQELIAYTDKNIRLYFDLTSDAKRQVKDLNDFLAKGIEKEKIDALEYIYLKAEGRIYYK